LSSGDAAVPEPMAASALGPLPAVRRVRPRPPVAAAAGGVRWRRGHAQRGGGRGLLAPAPAALGGRAGPPARACAARRSVLETAGAGPAAPRRRSVARGGERALRSGARVAAARGRAVLPLLRPYRNLCRRRASGRDGTRPARARADPDRRRT